MNVLDKLFAASVGGLRFVVFSVLIAFYPLVNFVLTIAGALACLGAILGAIMMPPGHLTAFAFWGLLGGGVACGLTTWAYGFLLCTLDPLN